MATSDENLSISRSDQDVVNGGSQSTIPEEHSADYDGYEDDFGDFRSTYTSDPPATPVVDRKSVV